MNSNKHFGRGREIFQDRYVKLRLAEKRIYSEIEIRNLPLVESSHPHFHEWKFRKKSSEMLIKYLSKSKKRLKILEIGCGNGWLSNKLSNIPGSEILGIDINRAELDQARAIFKNPNLSFSESDMEADPFYPADLFNVAVFAASIQYFPSFHSIIIRAMKSLDEAGEIHIIDSHFYRQNELNIARKRTEQYFDSIGFPEMTNHYFHHLKIKLNLFSFKYMYKPGLIRNFLKKDPSPFPWICIKKQL